MKVLLAMIMTTAFSASAFGACSISTVGQCKDRSECVALSKEGGVQFDFQEGRAQKCMSVDTKGTTNCLQTNNSPIAKTGESTGSGTSSSSSSAAQK